jgi:site-specific recombinase XerD
MVAVQTGLRLSELTGLKRQDVIIGTGTHVRCMGKGRKERCTPLTKQTTVVLKNWLNELEKADTETVFPNARSRVLIGDGVRYILAKHIGTASRGCPSLLRKNVTPHVLRHTTAMELLQAGVDRQNRRQRTDLVRIGSISRAPGSAQRLDVEKAQSRHALPYRVR